MPNFTDVVIKKHIPKCHKHFIRHIDSVKEIVAARQLTFSNSNSPVSLVIEDYIIESKSIRKATKNSKKEEKTKGVRMKERRRKGRQTEVKRTKERRKKVLQLVTEKLMENLMHSENVQKWTHTKKKKLLKLLKKCKVEREKNRKRIR